LAECFLQAALSLPADRHLDALRILTAAATAAMADAAVRMFHKLDGMFPKLTEMFPKLDGMFPKAS
jgi:hypothetical protein